MTAERNKLGNQSFNSPLNIQRNTINIIKLYGILYKISNNEESLWR